MNKTLRFSLLSMLMMLCGSVFAQQVTLDFDNDYATLFPTITGTSSNDSHDGDFTATTTSTAVSGVTVTVSAKTSGNNENRIWSSAPRLRMYSGTFTVSGKEITKIEFTGHSTNFNLSTTTGTLNGKTWTGKADQVVFEVSKNTQINKIVVTLGEGGDTPGPGPDPEIQTVANIAAFKALADGTEAKLTLNNAEVLYAGTNDIYVRDASGAIDFYKAGLNLTTGNVLNGSVIGKYTLYNTTPEFVSTSNTNGNNIQQKAGNVQPKAISPADAAKYICDLVKISGATIIERVEGTYTNIYAVVGSQEVQIYDKFKVIKGEVEEGKTYDIVGIVVPFKESVEICPISDYTDGSTPGPGPDPEIKTVANIAAFKALSTKTEAELTLKDAEVLYVNGTSDIYVRDASGAIDFYNTGLTFTAGQKLNGSVIGIYDTYKNTPELTKSSNTNDSKISKASGTVTAKSINAADAANYICDLVKINGATLTESDGKFYVDDVQLYDKFKVVKGAPETGKSYDIEGILIMYDAVIELCPTSDYTNGEAQPDEIKDATVAEFNAAAESTNVWYKLKGEVKNLKDGDKYGNFDLEDATGSVYVYGLLSEKGGMKEQFQALAAEKGIKNGCKITIIGNRGSYGDKIEVLNAYFVSLDEAAPAEITINGETTFEESTVVTIIPSDVDHDVYYTLDGTDPKTSSTQKRYMEPFTITETCTVKAWEEDADIYAEKTFTKKAIETISVEDVIAAAPESTTAAEGQQKVWVKGYIVGFVEGQALATGAKFTNEGCEIKTNLLIATEAFETDLEKCIPIQLPAGAVRDGLNLQDHPDNYGKEVMLLGYVLKYFSVPGMRNVTEYRFTGNNSVELLNIDNMKDGKMYNIAGQRVNDSFKGIVIMNGKKFIVK